MRFSRTMMIAGVAALAVAAAPGPRAGAAESFLGAGFELGEDDLALLKAAAGKLFLSDDVAVGTVEAWDNPETGSRGTVRLLETREYQGMPCRRLQHDFVLKDAAAPHRFVLDRCRTADGEWKIAAPGTLR